MNKIAICFGTRPEYLKIKPILKYLDKKHYSLFYITQHMDIKEKLKNCKKIFISNTQLNSNRLNNISSEILKKFKLSRNIKYVLVQGDTQTALICSIAAFNMGKQILHVEAGLRSFDKKSPFPEEVNRIIISNIADFHFAPTKLAKINLINEKKIKNIFVVGNTALDNLTELRKKSFYGNIIPITLHRREKLHEIKKWASSINLIAEKNPSIKFIFILHPNPIMKKYFNQKKYKFLHFIESINHAAFMNLINTSRLIITDSGGIQEEGSFLNKKIIVCRSVTERPEGINSGHLYLCNDYKKLAKIFNKIKNDYKINKTCPYGDGKAGKRIAKKIVSLL